MSAEPLLPVYLLVGTDRPKVGRALARLRGRFHEQSIEALSAEKTPEREAATGADAAAACNAIGLFAGDSGRLVVVEGVERWKAGDAQAVAAYLDDPAPGVVLALVAIDPPRAAGLVEACKKAGQVLAYDLPRPRDLPAWVRSEFERRNVPVDHETARALVQAVGDDPLLLAGEVEKIVTWAGGEPVGTTEVEALAVSAHEVAPWDLTDAWGAGDAAGVLRACERALEGGKEPFVVALGLVGHLTLVRDAERLANAGHSVRETAKQLGKKNEFPVRKALVHSEQHPRDERDATLVRLAELDAALKGASRLGAELELERALVDITVRGEPVGRRPGAS